MEETLNSLTEYLSSMPILAVCAVLFGLALLQYVFPPVPSDTLLVAMGVMAYTRAFGGIEIFSAYTLGSILGAVGLYELCYLLGDKVRKIGFIKKLINDADLEKARVKLAKYGGISYFFLRFVPSMQCVTIISFGLTKIKRGAAYFCLITVGILSCAAYFFIGYFLGGNLKELSAILEDIGIAGWIILSVIIAAAVSALIVINIKKNKKK